MRIFLLKFLRSPNTGESLGLYIFKRKKGFNDLEEDISEGLLVSKKSKKAYPIIDGVPVMLDDSFTQDFINRNIGRINEIKLDNPGIQILPVSSSGKEWSFSIQWEKFFREKISKTWGFTVEQRREMFLLETQTDEDWCKDKIIFDAGCGNGQLAESLTTMGATVIALDYSNSVFFAEKNRNSDNVHFIKGDLQNPPFNPAVFDLIFSSGVLHHTPKPYETFSKVSQLVKPNGLFYVWLYSSSRRFTRRLMYLVFNMLRTIISRMPKCLQHHFVKLYAICMYLREKLIKKSEISLNEQMISAYDYLATRWVFYQTPTEVSYWFFKNGFSPGTITHWDNPSGFGMVASKRPQKKVPGVNYSNPNFVPHYDK